MRNGVNITENEEFISISKGKIEARVRKYPWEVSYYLDGKLKTKEQIKDSNVDNMCKNLPVGFTYDENKEIIGVNETMYLYADEEFYGFGEKFTDFGKRGQTINCWQTDALSTNTEKSYKNHPFFMSSRGYAILLNTYTRSKFEMGSFSNVAYNMSVEDKVLDYVIWMGNDYKALLKSYINQTGKIPMIPKWALGLWMSKCSYQTQDEIYEVVKISKERDIKIDVIHIDGWQKEGDAGAWVWDYERFPNPEEMIYKLKKEGIHLCLWIFPYIDENSKYFKEAEEKGFLVKNTKGVTSRFYSTATSTSKVGCFDFTNPHFIEWYKPKVRSVVSMGIGAVKTDFSEAVPEDAVYFDGSTGIQGHNKLTFLYVGNGDSIDAIDNTNYYTKVEDAVRFVEQTGCDSLAIAVGNAHGPYVKTPNLDLERIYAIRKKVNIPLVLHGCSDIPEEQMKEAVNLGMSKFNIATEYFRTMYQSIEKRINNQEFEGNGVKLMYDIKEEMIDFVIQKIRLLNPNKYSM